MSDDEYYDDDFWDDDWMFIDEGDPDLAVSIMLQSL